MRYDLLTCNRDDKNPSSDCFPSLHAMGPYNLGCLLITLVRAHLSLWQRFARNISYYSRPLVQWQR